MRLISFNFKTSQLSLICALIFLFLSTSKFAQTSGNTGKEYYFSTEEQLQVPAFRDALDYFYNQGIEGTFPGMKNISIHYKIFRQPTREKGAIVLSTGRTEGAVKFKELIYDLYQNGYSVYIHDHRGQGLSGRMTPDPEMGHVDNFQFYVDDLKKFYDELVSQGNHREVFLLAHSMGGLIGMSYIEQYPDDFRAAAFTSPMLGVGAFICPLAKILSGKTVKYAPGMKGYSDDSTAFKGNDVAGSEIRYHMKIAAYANEPEAKVGGPSIQWVNESCKKIKSVHKNIDKINIPVLIFAAENESVVNPSAFSKFIKKAKKLNKNCILYPIADARHELLMEKDHQRNEVLKSTLQFFNEF